MNKILYKLTDGKPSFWLMRDVPERIEEFTTKGGLHFELGGDFNYSKAIEQSKANALEIINPELIKKQLWESDQRINNPISMYDWERVVCKDGDIFPFPDSLEFEESVIWEKHFSESDESLGRIPMGAKVATGHKIIRLIPKQKEESQDELWREAMQDRESIENLIPK